LGEALATTVFLGEGFGVDFDLGFGAGLGVTFTFGVGTGLAVDVGFGDGAGVAAGSWISLFTEVKTGRSSSASFLASDSDTGGGVEIFAAFGGGILFAGAPAPSPAPPFIQTMLCGFLFFGPALQRTSPVMSAT
jgi:hypothetical protein